MEAPVARSNQLPSTEPVDPPMIPDENLIELLGEKPKEGASIGPDIHSELACRWTRYLWQGINKEDRINILGKYPTAANCSALKAPALNPEVEAILNPTTLKQDKFLSQLQNQIAGSLSAMALPLTIIVSDPAESNNRKEELQQLADASKGMADVMHSLSLHRRYLITPSLNTQCRKLVDNAGIGEYLYDTNLQESLKSAQTVKRAGAEIRAPIPRKKKTLGTTRPYAEQQPQPSTSRGQQYHLNYLGPASKSRYKQRTPQVKGEKRRRDQPRFYKHRQ